MSEPSLATIFAMVTLLAPVKVLPVLLLPPELELPGRHIWPPTPALLYLRVLLTQQVAVPGLALPGL